MKPSYQKQHAALLKKILAALPKTTSASEKYFVGQFYAKVLVAELEKLTPEQAAAIARSAFAFFTHREANTPTIRIFTPTNKEHGYSSNSLVVELINDDMPFLLDSLTSDLSRHGFIIRRTYHPIFMVTREESGSLESLGKAKDTHPESLIHFELSPIPEGLTFQQLEHSLRRTLNHIEAAVRDWKAMLARAEEVIGQLKKPIKQFEASHVEEVRDFMAWLAARNFVFLGYGDYRFDVDKATGNVEIIAKEKLGILTITGERSHKGLEGVAPEQRHHLLTKNLLEITKTNRRSLVHRRVPMDYVSIKHFDNEGNVIGETRFVGLFTSNVYYQSASMIPMLRDKIGKIFTRSGFTLDSHDGKALNTILEFLPRDIVLQMTEDELFEMSMGILALEIAPGVGVFVREDVLERFVNAMVLVPREQFSTSLRYQIQNILEEAYDGTTTAFTTQITEAPLARLQLTVRTTPGAMPKVDSSRLEKDIARHTYLWSDQLMDSLSSQYDEAKALALHRRYSNAFPPAYITRYDAVSASKDIGNSERAMDQGIIQFDIFQIKEEQGFAHLKIYNAEHEITLSDILPILENTGFHVIEEYPFVVEPKDVDSRIRIRDFKLALPDIVTHIDARKQTVEAVLLAVWQKEIEDDLLNSLVLLADVTYQEVVVLRAMTKYLKQIGLNASQANVRQALVKHPLIAKLLIDLFHARFDPDATQRDVKVHSLRNQIEKELEHIDVAVEDRILRTICHAMLAILRTNYYQENRPALSCKFNSASVPGMPLPVPFAEIFVYSPRVEGIHLRGGKVARGGLRWSDRPDDFRTEVLGLMKAQMVKNAVIVPVGSKGGFVLKKPPSGHSREALQKEAIECYKIYLQGLLDITDNLKDGKPVTPERVVRHDGDDPYLVVAADKGTASFSDIANGVAADYGFWLGDAFASGGSAGYDHKEMGITARGAWISVERHFHEMGRDISKEDFTCVGIGDMSGDVFGNGMLLSKHTRLIAAFNHLHIFIDPTPDAATSYEERKRLFDLPRSSWKDYDESLISKGGGVFERSAKNIVISAEAMKALGVTQDSFTPEELIQAILLSPVDLLWNGGIGTYVKSEGETHDEVGDRANNALRVNGKDLRCKIVGEGGNLGFTQKGRIEYALRGGRINTDAIDNSAGVDCSDHEVNIKITFSDLLAKNILSLEKRDALLENMTDEVASLVLKDNRLQTLAISIAEQLGGAKLDAQIHLMHTLEKKGLLDRIIEYLPSDQQLAKLKERHGSLTRPELSVLLAYSKMDLYRSLIDSDVLSNPYFENELLHYFPQPMRDSYRDAILQHPLRREIIGTMLTNSLVNRMGCTFINEVCELQQGVASDVAVAYAIVRDAFGLRDHWMSLDRLTGKIPTAQQAELFTKLQLFMKNMTLWLLANYKAPLPIDDICKELIKPAQQRINAMEISEEAREKAANLMQQEVPENLAHFIANMHSYSNIFDIVHLARENKLPEDAVAKIYGQIAGKFALN